MHGRRRSNHGAPTVCHSCLLSNVNGWEDLGHGVPIFWMGNQPVRSQVGLDARSPDPPPHALGLPHSHSNLRGFWLPTQKLPFWSLLHIPGMLSGVNDPPKGKGQVTSGKGQGEYKWGGLTSSGQAPTVPHCAHASLPQSPCSFQPQRGEEAVSAPAPPKSPKN